MNKFLELARHEAEAVEHYLEVCVLLKKVNKLLKELDKPEIGEPCEFWDDDRNKNFFDRLKFIDYNSELCFVDTDNTGWKNCAKIKKEAEF